MADFRTSNADFLRIMKDGDEAGPVEVTTYLDFADAVWLLHKARKEGISPPSMMARLVKNAAFGDGS